MAAIRTDLDRTSRPRPDNDDGGSPTTHSPPPAISVTGLSRRYGDHRAVTDLSFTVPAGRVTGFLGPNGAGKTTTIRMMLGLVRPDAGHAAFDGRPFAELDDPARQVGVMIEGAQAHPGRTALDHLRILATERRVDVARIDQALDRVRLTDARNRKVGGFSLGMRQRLDLAAALLGDPRTLILDEPANGLDPAGIRWLREFLQTFASDGGTVFVSSHQLAETARLAHDVVVINHGRLITHTPVARLTTESIVTARSPQVDTLTRRLESEGGDVRRTGPDAVEISGVAIAHVGAVAHAAAVELHELSARTGTLEDVFLDLTSEGDRP